MCLRSHDERLGGISCFLSEQGAETIERPAIGKTQALGIGCTPIDSKAVEIAVIVRVVVEMALQSTVLAQFVVHVELAYDIGGIVACIASHHADVGLDGESILEQLSPQGHLVFVVRIDASRMIADS